MFWITFFFVSFYISPMVFLGGVFSFLVLGICWGIGVSCLRRLGGCLGHFGIHGQQVCRCWYVDLGSYCERIIVGDWTKDSMRLLIKSFDLGLLCLNKDGHSGDKPTTYTR